MKYILGLLLLACAAIAIYDESNPFVCAEQKKIKSILSIQYRSATLEFEDGSTLDVNQAHAKPNDMFCTKWKRAND